MSDIAITSFLNTQNRSQCYLTTSKVSVLPFIFNFFKSFFKRRDENSTNILIFLNRKVSLSLFPEIWLGSFVWKVRISKSQNIKLFCFQLLSLFFVVFCFVFFFLFLFLFFCFVFLVLFCFLFSSFFFEKKFWIVRNIFSIPSHLHSF